MRLAATVPLTMRRQVLRGRRLISVSVGSRRWRICWCGIAEEECVITPLLRLVFISPGGPHVALNPQAPGEPSGSWDSIHVFEAAERGRQAHYKLTSTIMLHLVDRSLSSRSSKEEVVKSKYGSEKTEQSDAKRDGEIALSGSMTRQTEQDYPLQDQTSHITNTGKMIEEMEIKMRNLLQEVRFSNFACAA